MEECARTIAENPDFLDVGLMDGTPAPKDAQAIPSALRGETVSTAEYLLRRKDSARLRACGSPDHASGGGCTQITRTNYLIIRVSCPRSYSAY
jgi:hypothetical protein